MNIYFDFDHTLFDTSRLKTAVRGLFLAGGVSPEAYDRTYQASASSGGFDPTRLAERLTGEWRDEASKDEALADVMGFLESASDCVFEGVTGLLVELKARGNRLILLTRGDLGWQKAKLSCSGLESFFDDVQVTPELKAKRLANIVGPNDSGAVVDDNVSELAAMMAVRPKLRYIYFHRPHNPHVGPGCEEAASVAEVRHLLIG